MTKWRSLIVPVAVWTIAGVLSCPAQQQTPHDVLEQGFAHPPDSAKPRTWWHWTNGNVTLDGITKDLEWMHRVGIGGFQLVDVSAGGGQTVDKKIYFGTPEWYGAVRHAAEEGKRLGLEMSIFSSPGWSEAGGPWVKPEEAMKRLVWSETTFEGARKIHAVLPMPPSNEGPIRDLSVGGARRGAGAAQPPSFYRDSVVVAYRTPPDAADVASLHPRVTTNEGPIDATPLMDDNLNTSVTVRAPADGSPAWLQFEFAQPFTARALSLGSHGGIPVGRILASNDGKSFRPLAVMPGPQGYHGAQVRTFAFPSTTARFFRVELSGAPLRPAAVIEGGPVLPAPEFTITEAMLYSDARVNRWEDKGSFGSLMDVYDVVPTPPSDPNAEIDRGSVIDLTAKMAKDGTLDWDAPAGRWTVLRMGYALTGATNHPAVASGAGYEVDKLNAQYVKRYFDGYMDPILQSLGPLAGSELRYMTMDSWEAGMQNWTDDMIAEFRRRRGYDPTPYLPVLAGHVVGSNDLSDRFLWDFRRTLADLFADDFYGTMEQELKQHGMGSYAEASGVALEIPEDTLLNKSHIDVPMAEFWVHALHPESMYYVDVRGAASAGHVYGKPIIAAEAFTGGGYESPYTLKKVADYWFAQGINRLVFHTSAQQPTDSKPGNTMVGTHINRNITWAEEAAPLMTYIARTSFLLQQGRYVADLAYLLPEGAPSTMPFWGAGLLPAPPAGYNYDYVNTDVLLHGISVADDGRITLPDGMSYRALVLPPTRWMTPDVLRKIHDLVEAGATVVGPRPVSSPSLASYSQADMHALTSDLWGDTDGVTKTQQQFGKGMVVWGESLDAVLAKLDVRRDFDAGALLDHNIAWIHRRAGDADLYFVVNEKDAAEDVVARFRVSGKAAELWHPDTGAMEPISYRFGEGVTSVPLHLSARESVFVVFRQKTETATRMLNPPVSTSVLSVAGPWSVGFEPGLGAPSGVISMEKLRSWTGDAREGVKYFSGTAIYTKAFRVPAMAKGRRFVLDLGEVGDLAQVRLNGKDLGTLWKPPYRIDVTETLKPGTNELRIAVTNEWTNRLIGDRLLPPDKRILASGPPVFARRPATPSARPQPPSVPPATVPDWRNDGLSPRIGGAHMGGFSILPQQPLDSGLMGPVRIIAVTNQN